MGPVMGCGKGERDIAWLRTNQSRQRWVTESTKQQPLEIGKPVALKW